MADDELFKDTIFRGFAFGREREWRIFWAEPDPALGDSITFRMLDDDGHAIDEVEMRVIEIRHALKRTFEGAEYVLRIVLVEQRMPPSTADTEGRRITVKR